MSQLEFNIGDWVQAIDPDPRFACTTAELTINVGDVPVTRLFDSWSKTVTDRARLPLYPLAEWFASNWWRLHAETASEGAGIPPVDWRLSHDLTAIGGGYIWPRMRFATDNRTIQISARAVRSARWEPVRHLNDIHPAQAVETQAFDAAVEGLISFVLSRMNDVGVPAEPLRSIWSDVLAERSDPAVFDWRTWEARLGYDPEEAPDCLMNQLAGLFGTAGKEASIEIAPLLNDDGVDVLKRIYALAAVPGVEAVLPMRSQFSANRVATPWEAGRELAHRIREKNGQTTGALTDAQLAEFLGCAPSAFKSASVNDVPISLGILSESENSTSLHFRRRNFLGRRFEAARFLADSIYASNEDSWLPLTDRGSARQKFQRAFAAELLIPIEDIRPEFERRPSAERIEELADDYAVSSLTVRSQLVNHGLLNQDNLMVA